MAAPSYTTDLTTITTEAIEESATGWLGIQISGSSAVTANETDFYIVDNNCLSRAAGAIAGGQRGMIYGASSQTITADSAVFVWIFYQAAAVLDTEANGGLRVLVGSGTGDYNRWNVGGVDTYLASGWINVAVDPATTVDATVGSPTATTSYWGFTCAGPSGGGGPTKGNPQGVNRFRWGRELRITGGDLGNGYATFAGSATTNDSTANKWGLFSNVGGSYLMKGAFVMGLSGTAVDFRDSNAVIFIANTKKVTSGFNKFEIRHASSRVDWTAVAVVALGTVARGNFLVTDNADVNIDACSFTNMGTFTLLAATAITNSTLRSCDTVTAPGSNLSGTSILTSRVAVDAGALVWDVATDPDGLLDDMSFSKGTNAHHAITFGTNTPTSISLRGWTVTGFSGANGDNDSVIYNNSGHSITVNVFDNTGTITYKNGAGASTTIVAGAVSATVTIKDVNGNNINDARVFVKASDNTGPFPFEESVTIANAFPTATVTHTGHGMATNDKVVISGASHDVNNGIFTITLDGGDPTNKYTYTIGSNPGSNPTGTIISTFVVLSGLTAGTPPNDGQITMSRVFSSAQPITGWARKSTDPPYYKTAIITGIVSASAGFSATALLILDQ